MVFVCVCDFIGRYVDGGIEGGDYMCYMVYIGMYRLRGLVT
jgi:hypothetical protein